MPTKRNPKTVVLNVEGFNVKIVLKYEGYELYVDGVLVDEWKGLGLAIPFIQGTRLTAEPRSGTYIEANIRNMGVGFRLEVSSNSALIHSQFFM